MNNDQIHVRAEFTIEKGKIEEFKKLIQDMSRMVENSEPDTINISFISIDLKQSVWSMKHTQIQRVYLLTLLALHRKQYFQRFSIFQN